MKKIKYLCFYLIGAAFLSLVLTVYLIPPKVLIMITQFDTKNSSEAPNNTVSSEFVARKDLISYQTDGHYISERPKIQKDSEEQSFNLLTVQKDNQLLANGSYRRNGDLERQVRPDDATRIENNSSLPGEKEESREGAGSKLLDIRNEKKTPNNVSPSHEDWMKQVEQRFEARRVFLSEGCSRLEGLVKENAKQTMKTRLYFTPKYNLTVCIIAKVGSSTWKSNLFAIAGRPRDRNVHIKAATKMFAKKFFTERSLYDLMEQTSSGIKVFTVRHPLDRLVSAYRDKYKDGASTIVKRGNMFFLPLLKELNLELDPDRKMTVTFPQFLLHVIRDHETRFTVNAHWRGYARTCSPCTFSYSHIMTTDTWEEDMAFLINKLNISEVKASNRLHTLSTSPHEGKANYFSYYKDVEVELLRKIYRIYKVDFELFNYTLPDFIEKAIKGA